MNSTTPTVAGDLDHDAAKERVRGQLFGDEGDAPTIARFTVLRTLGSGGMGTVYAVHDPRLDRQIALKVLRHDQLATPEQRMTRRARLIREARAMGRLSHPNVGAVYEVGVVDEPGREPQVWIAMELVDGEGLHAWCKRERPSVRAILEVYAQFGRGLAAAHAAGLVHRDVKPENAMRDTAGRVRVLDFGLARGSDEVPTLTSGAGLEGLDGLSFTRTGAVIGTPAYMAPEQFDGAVADARADQYAFCVALYEALWGRPPHEARSVVELAAARRCGDLVPPPRRRDVPRRVRAMILRGLSPRPDDRWPSMAEVVRTIEPTASRSVVPIGLAAAAAVSLAAWRPWSSAPEPCPDPIERLVGVWDAPRADAVGSAFGATGSPIADEAAARVRERLDAYASQWRAAVVEACRATQIERTQSAARMDARMACLDRRLHHLDAIAGALVDADRERVLGAVETLGRLGDLDECADASRAAAYPMPTDPELRARIERFEGQIAELDAQWITMDTALRLTTARALLDEARAIDHPPAVLRALEELQEAATNATESAAAMDALRQLAQLAATLRDDATEALAWTSLLALQTNLHHHEAARELEPVAVAAVARAGDPVRLRFRLELARAMRRLYAEEYAGAIGGFTQALAIASNDLERSLAGQQLAQAIALGQGPTAAIEAGEQALVATETAFGPGHPRTGDALHLLASFVAGPNQAGAPTPERATRLDRAESLQARALAIYEATLPPTHRDLAIGYHQAADLALWRGDRVRARALYERAVPIFVAGRGTDDAALSLGMLAGLVADDEGLGAARGLYERALEAIAATYGRDHRRYAHMEMNFAQRMVDADECPAAEPRLEHAVEVLATSAPGDAPWALVLHADCDERHGRLDAAITRLERGAALCIAHGCPFAMDVDFALGRALIESRRDPTRGAALVDAAAQRAEREGAADMLDEIATWQRARR